MLVFLLCGMQEHFHNWCEYLTLNLKWYFELVNFTEHYSVRGQEDGTTKNLKSSQAKRQADKARSKTKVNLGVCFHPQVNTKEQDEDEE